MLLIKIIHAAGGAVFLVMTDNLSVNKKLFKMLHQNNPENHLQQLSIHTRTFNFESLV